MKIGRKTQDARRGGYLRNGKRYSCYILNSGNAAGTFRRLMLAFSADGELLAAKMI